MGDEKLIALLLMQQIAVLFLIMGLGFLIVKLGIVKTEDSRVLSMVTIYLVLPCVTIHAFQIEYSTKIRNGFLLAVVVAILIHVVLFMVCGILRKLLKMDEVETASLIYSNAGNLILPLVTSILGEEWVIYASGFMCVQTIIVWTHGQSLMQGQRQVNLEEDRAEYQFDRDSGGTGIFPVQYPSAEDSRFYDFIPCGYDRSDQYGDDRYAFGGC